MFGVRLMTKTFVIVLMVTLLLTILEMKLNCIK